VYAGIEPLTRRPSRLKSTVKTGQQAQIELGRLLKEASEGRTPETGVTMAKLMDEYVAIAEWDVSTRQTSEGFIRRTIKPALGPMKVRKVRGPILDKLYAELKRCGDLSCTGKPFIEHRNVPVLAVNPRDRHPAWQQVAAALTEAIRSGTLAPGDELPRPVPHRQRPPVPQGRPPRCAVPPGSADDRAVRGPSASAVLQRLAPHLEATS
jgi:hypothetical protein